MKASALPPSASPVPADPVSAAAPAADTAETGNNFVGMLMQLLGGTAPAALTSASTTATARTTDTDTELEDPTALAAMLAMPIQAPLPWNPLPAGTAGEGGGDPLEMLGLGAGRGKSTGLDALLASKDVADTLDDAATDAPAPDGNDGIGSLSLLNDVNAAKGAQADVSDARRVQAPVGSPQWTEELGSKLTLMVDRNQHSASLKLSPDHLGPLEVRISIADDKASVWFGAAHADTRAAIEHALPRLREMLASTGLSLGDTGVFREPPRDQQPSASRNFNGSGDSAAPETEMAVSTRSLSLLDAYA